LDIFQGKPKQITQALLSLSILLLFLTACSGAEISSGTQPQVNQANSNLANQKENTTPIPGRDISLGENLRFENYSLEEGLSQSSVFSSVQDQQGFIWFATEDGLNRFDGYEFTIYRHDPDFPGSLSDNWINILYVDKVGRFWIGTNEGGLELYDSETDRFIHHKYNPEDPGSISDNEITAIFQDHDGILWIGTGNGILNRFDEEKGVFVHYQPALVSPSSIRSNSITTIHEDSLGLLWIGTESAGLNRFDLENNLWTNFKNNPAEPYSLSHDSISVLFKDSGGTLWIGNQGGGIDHFDPENERFIHIHDGLNSPDDFGSNTISALYEDQNGKFWIASMGGGIYLYDSEKDSIINYRHVPGDSYSLRNNYIVSIFEDQEGGLWFGTAAAGVNKLHNGWRNFAHYKNESNNSNSLSNNIVRIFLIDSEDNLWIGTLEGGVNRFDREKNIWTQFIHDPEDPSSLSNNFINAIYQDRLNRIWIGTSSGLDRFEPSTGTFTHFLAAPTDPQGSPKNYVRTIFEEPDGQFWIGTKGGLYRFDPEEGVWGPHYYHIPDDPFSLSENWVVKFKQDDEGKIWLGTIGGGVNWFDPEEEKFVTYQHDPLDPSSISNSLALDIVQDQEGVIWLATIGGLDRFEPDSGTFVHYREKDGLANNTVYCMVEDLDGNLWLGTSNGLSKLDSNRETFTNYYAVDGLQSNEFNGGACYVGPSEELIFGGINGFNIFYPDRIHANQFVPPIVLTSFTQDGYELIQDTSVSSISDITIKWPDNHFEFGFSALSYSHPEDNQYAYYLEGFEETWKEVGNRRFGEYTNLPGGTYTLRVKGSNNDGVWNEVGKSVQITVVPPFWQTQWFYGILIISISGLFYGGYRLRVKNLEERGRELESQVGQRTSELMQIQADLKQSEMEKAISEERNRLARDLHDSVTQSIYSLTLLAEAGQRMIRGGDHKQAESNQVRLGEISQQALQEMRLLVYELRPQVLRSEGLVGALEHRLEAVERRAGINARMHADGEIEIPPSFEEELFHISMEALNNSLKHAKASEVILNLNSDKDFLILVIEDDGLGFDQKLARSQGGMGLASISERVENIKGSLTILSESGSGTKIIVRVPIEDTSQPSSSTLEESS